VINGGATGTLVHSADYYQGAGSTFSDPYGTGFGQSYDNVLSEYVGLNVNVPAGTTGSASASFNTQTPQGFTYTNPGDGITTGPAVTSTSLNGALAVSVTKNDINGLASANAYMSAQSGAGSAIVGTSTLLYADAALTGNGTALAQVSKATATANSLYTDPNSLLPPDFSKSSVAGDIKLTAKNIDDSPAAIAGGTTISSAYISADSYESAPLDTEFSVGAANTRESMQLSANRGQSFSGTSYADGFLNGQEMTESTWNNPYGNDFGLTKATVDTESTSQITGSVVAHNIRDDAETYSLLSVRSNTWDDASASAHTWLDDWAQVTRDSTGSSGLKAEANAYMPIATWVSSGSLTKDFADPQVGNVASVAGNQGLAWDGQPSKNPGFGVGAWILNTYNQPQTAETYVAESANTADGSVDADFSLYLDGMKTITGTQDDAVGAFGAVANQMNSVKGEDNLGNTMDYNPKIKDVNAINWLVGDDANPVPGISQGKYSPADITIEFPTISAIDRAVELSYDPALHNPAE
jgi:hypothetical protein